MRLAVEMQPLLAAATAMERFPNNVACNSPEIASNIEFTSLELQRLWTMLKTDQGELRATFWGVASFVRSGVGAGRDGVGAGVGEWSVT